ncbi:transporter substrate-binding domain-containing protein [Streptomyces sp. NBC_00464]|uniref:transporter substrate-binding domain-containing protein n=1 Tax=Streptomyces sp. NBC_00464 TaxID=2975751 RepID=UPI002E177338
MSGAALRGWAAVTAAILLCGAVAGCESDPPSILSDSTEVGTKDDQPGTSFSPHGGQFIGFDVSVVGTLMNNLGYKTPRFTSVMSQDRIRVLHEGGVQLVAATFSITPDRMAPEGTSPQAGDLDFVGPYATTQQGFLIRKKDAAKFRKKRDFDGEIVCVWAGTTSANELSKGGFEKIVPRMEDDAKTCVKRLEAGTVAAVSTDVLILYGLTQEHRGLEVVPGLEFGEAPNQYGIAMTKGHREDCIRLRDELLKYIGNATAWETNFKSSLPAVPKAIRDEARPREEDVMDLSCVDKPGNGSSD